MRVIIGALVVTLLADLWFQSYLYTLSTPMRLYIIKSYLFYCFWNLLNFSSPTSPLLSQLDQYLSQNERHITMVTPGDVALRLYKNVFFLSNLSAIIYLFFQIYLLTRWLIQYIMRGNSICRRWGQPVPHFPRTITSRAGKLNNS